MQHGELGAVVRREALADVPCFDDGALRGHRPQRTNGFFCDGHSVLLKSLIFFGGGAQPASHSATLPEGELSPKATEGSSI